MKREQLKAAAVRTGAKNILLLALALASLLFAAGCPNSFFDDADQSYPPSPQETAKKFPAGMGAFSLNIAGVSSRSILPNNDFAVYQLDFYYSDSSIVAASADRYRGGVGDPVYLAAGQYNLLVTAYSDLGKTKDAAHGTMNAIDIGVGTVISGEITLAVYGVNDGGQGVFKWEIDYPEGLEEVKMHIAPVLGGDASAQTLYFEGGSGTNVGKTGYIDLDSGYYMVTFTLVKGSDFRPVTWPEILHVYKNMDSEFEIRFDDNRFRSYYTFRLISSGTEYSISKYTGSGVNVVIPDSYNGLPVTEIDGNAFEHKASIESITIPDSITKIGNFAFENCTSLTSVTIPVGVTTVGYNIFSRCTSLSSISVADGNTSFQSQDGILYNYGKTQLLAVPAAISGSVTIPATVTHIAAQAFAYCTSLNNITIPSGVTSIIEAAFYNCSSLTSITIPNTVEFIDSRAFSACINLTSVTFESGSVNIDDASAFPGSLREVYLAAGGGAGTYTRDNDSEVWTKLIVGTPGLQYTLVNSDTAYGVTGYTGTEVDVVIPPVYNGLPVLVIQDYAFMNKVIESITIPNSVTTIGMSAFQGCTNLESITIPASVTTIRDGAFNNCTNLESIDVDPGNGSFSSQDGILYNKTKTQLIRAPGGISGDVTIPGTVTTITNNAFQNCANLVNITIPASVTTIGNQAFHLCSSLESIIIPYGVSSIGNYMFENCVNLESVIIPGSVTSIGMYAFQNCTSLESIIIPDSVTSIAAYAFNGCTNLTSVTFEGTILIGNFSSDNSFPNFLFSAYFFDQVSGGGAGTYTRSMGGEWTKMSATAAVSIGGSEYTSLSDALTNGIGTTAGTYEITLTGNQSLEPFTFSGTNVRNITLQAPSGSSVTIELTANGSMFTLPSNLTLTLGNGINLRGRNGNNSAVVLVDNGGKLIMKDSASITDNAGTSTDGGGVYVYYGGVFEMINGTISENKASYGGGVRVYGGTFTMKGGTIIGNTAGTFGGGVDVDGGIFNMEGGTISGNKSGSYGGGVSVVYGGTFTMTAGEISGNTAGTYGGGVYSSDGTFKKQPLTPSVNSGIIYGYTVGDSLSNVVMNASNVVQSDKGHAVYIFNKKREKTVGQTESLDSTQTGAPGGWVDP
jgi:hypothetical protein